MARKNKRIEQTVPKYHSPFVRYFPPLASNGESYLARLIEQDGEYLDIQLPNKTKITTHIYNVGRA